MVNARHAYQAQLWLIAGSTACSAHLVRSAARLLRGGCGAGGAPTAEQAGLVGRSLTALLQHAEVT